MAQTTTVGGVDVVIGGDTKPLDAALRGMQDKVKAAGQRIASGAKTAAIAVGSVGLASAGAAAALAKAGIQFDRQMSEVRTLLGSVSDNEFARLKQDALDFAKNTGVAADEAVPALYQSISAGIPRENVFTFLETANKLAVGGVTTLETAVDGLTSVVNAYGEDTLNASQAADVMFTAVKLGKTTVDELSRSLFQVVPAATANAVEFEEVAAALAVMTQQGFPTSEATTRLRALMDQLGDSSKGVGAEIQKLTGQSFRAFQESGGNVGDLLTRLQGDMPIDDFKALFTSSEAASAALAIMADDGKALSSAMGAMRQSTGAAETAFKTMDATVGNQLNKVITNLQTMVIDLGNRAMPIVKQAVDTLLPPTRALIRDGFERAQSAIEFLTPHAVKLGNDVIPQIRAAIEQVGPIIKDIAEVAFKILGDTVVWITESVIPKLVEIWRDSLQPTIEWLGQWWRDNQEPIISAITTVAGGLRNLADVALNVLAPVFEKVVMPVLRILMGVIGAVIGTIARVIVAVSEWREHWNTVMTFLQSAMAGAADFITDALIGLVEGIQNMVNKIPGVSIDITSGLREWQSAFVDGLEPIETKSVETTDQVIADFHNAMDKVETETSNGLALTNTVVGEGMTSIADSYRATMGEDGTIVSNVKSGQAEIVRVTKENAQEILDAVDAQNEAVLTRMQESAERQFIVVDDFNKAVLDADRAVHNTRAEQWMEAKRKEAEDRREAHEKRMEMEEEQAKEIAEHLETALAEQAEIRKQHMEAELKNWQAHHTSMANATRMALEAAHSADLDARRAALDAAAAASAYAQGGENDENVGSSSGGGAVWVPGRNQYVDRRFLNDSDRELIATGGRGYTSGSTRTTGGRSGITRTRTGNVVHVPGVGDVNIGNYTSFAEASAAVGGTHTLPTSGPPGGFAPPGSNISSPSIKEITGKAFGGFAHGGRILVGERGPEVVNIPYGSQVTPTHALRDSMGNDTINVNIRGDFIGDRRGVTKLVKQIEEARRRNFRI